MQGTPIFLKVGPGGILYPYYEGHFHGVIGGNTSAVQIDARERLGSGEVLAPEYYPDHLSFKVPPPPPSGGVRVLPRPIARIWGEYPSTVDPPAAGTALSRDRLVVGTGTDKNGKLLLDSAGKSDWILESPPVPPSSYFSGWGPYPSSEGIKCWRRGNVGIVRGIISGAAVWAAGQVYFRLPWFMSDYHYITHITYSGSFLVGNAYITSGGDVTCYTGGSANPPAWAAFDFVIGGITS